MKEHNCDILVVGGGGSGLVAAVRARELSGKKVVVLESGKMPGGGMMFASTMRTFHSRWQQERNIPDQANDFIRKGMDLTLWKLNPKLVTRAVLGTGAFFDWYYEKELPEIQAKYEARPYVFDIPVAATLDLKKAAKAVGEKSIELLHVAEINAVTGYIRGGCSPVGMKKQYPTVFHRTALDYETVYISAGKIGAQVELAPRALLDLLGASTADIVAEQG